MCFSILGVPKSDSISTMSGDAWHLWSGNLELTENLRPLLGKGWIYNPSPEQSLLTLTAFFSYSFASPGSP
jgi:hypothetical protein